MAWSGKELLASIKNQRWTKWKRWVSYLRRRHNIGEIARQLFPASKASGRLIVRLIKQVFDTEMADEHEHPGVVRCGQTCCWNACYWSQPWGQAWHLGSKFLGMVRNQLFWKGECVWTGTSRRWLRQGWEQYWWTSSSIVLSLNSTNHDEYTLFPVQLTSPRSFSTASTRLILL